MAEPLLAWLDKHCIHVWVQQVSPYGRLKNRVVLEYFDADTGEVKVLGAASLAGAAAKAKLRIEGEKHEYQTANRAA